MSDTPTVSCIVWTSRSYAQSVQLRSIHISKLLSGYGRLKLTAVPLTVCGMKYLWSNINNGEWMTESALAVKNDMDSDSTMQCRPGIPVASHKWTRCCLTRYRSLDMPCCMHWITGDFQPIPPLITSPNVPPLRLLNSANRAVFWPLRQIYTQTACWSRGIVTGMGKPAGLRSQVLRVIVVDFDTPQPTAYPCCSITGIHEYITIVWVIFIYLFSYLMIYFFGEFIMSHCDATTYGHFFTSYHQTALSSYSHSHPTSKTR